MVTKVEKIKYNFIVSFGKEPNVLYMGEKEFDWLKNYIPDSFRPNVEMNPEILEIRFFGMDIIPVVRGSYLEAGYIKENKK